MGLITLVLMLAAHIVLREGLVRDSTHIESLQWVWLWGDSLGLGRWHRLIRGLGQISQLQAYLLEELLCVFGYGGDQLPDQVKVVNDRPTCRVHHINIIGSATAVTSGGHFEGEGLGGEAG